MQTFLDDKRICFRTGENPEYDINPPIGPHKNLLNSNLVSKLVSTAAEWIVLSEKRFKSYDHISIYMSVLRNSVQ